MLRTLPVIISKITTLRLPLKLQKWESMGRELILLPKVKLVVVASNRPII